MKLVSEWKKPNINCLTTGEHLYVRVKIYAIKGGFYPLTQKIASIDKSGYSNFKLKLYNITITYLQK